RRQTHLEAYQDVAEDARRGDRQGWRETAHRRQAKQAGHPARRSGLAVARQRLYEPLSQVLAADRAGRKLKAPVINYAGDFVILSRGCAAEAKAWAAEVMSRLGLKLNETKTCLRNACKERFDFLGYSFGPHYFPKDGQRYLGASPSKKNVARLKP